MKNNRLYLSVICFILILSACKIQLTTTPSNSIESISEYKIVTEIFSYNNVDIQYPKIVGFKDDEKQTTINAILKSRALKLYNNSKDEYPNIEIKDSYEVKWKSPSLLSVVYVVTSKPKFLSYSYRDLSTINIDIDTAKEIYLSNVIKINNKFITILSKGSYVCVKNGEQLKTQLPPDYEKLNADDIITDEYFIDHFSKKSACYYFSEDSLILIREIPKTFGDYAEQAIKYTDLNQLLKISVYNKI